MDVVERDRSAGRVRDGGVRVSVRESDRPLSAEPVAGCELRRAVCGGELCERDERAIDRFNKLYGGHFCVDEIR